MRCFPESSSPAAFPHNQRLCPECEDEERRQTEDSGKQRIQAKNTSDQSAEVPPQLETYLHSSRGAGQPLPESVRTSMEGRLEQDFNGVRVHTDEGAAGAVESVNGRAFTAGQNIYFGHGQYRPDTSEGQQLLAHELTHSIQQTGGQVSRLIQRFPPSERGGESAPSEGGGAGGGHGGAAPTTSAGSGGEAPASGGGTETGEQEEIYIPSFDTGGEGGCPKLVEQEPLFPNGGGPAAATSEGGEGERRAGAETGRGQGGETAGGERSPSVAPETGAGGESARLGSRVARNGDPYSQLVGLMPGMGLGGAFGSAGLALRLIGYGGATLWRALPLRVRAQVVNRAIELAISGAAFVPRMAYATIFGPLAGWFRAGLIAFLKRIQGLGNRMKVFLFEKYLSIVLGQNVAFMWGYVKGIFEGFFVDGLIGIIQMIIDIICLIGKIPQLISTLRRFFGAFPEHMQKVALAIVRFSRALDTAAANAFTEVRAMFRDPRRIVGLFETLGAASEAVGRRMGEMVADGLIRFMRLPAERIGKTVGRLSGMLLFEVVLIVATWGGGAAATVGKVVTKVGIKLFTAIGRRLLAIGRFIMNMLRMLMPFVRRAAAHLTRFFRGVADRLHDMMRAVADFFSEILSRCRPARSWWCWIRRLLSRRRFTWRTPRIGSGVRQTGLRNPGEVSRIKEAMLNRRYGFEEDRGRIAGWLDDAGNYHIGEGHHRMNAALEIFEETGDASYVNRLLENGLWTPGNPPAPGPLPRR